MVGVMACLMAWVVARITCLSTSRGTKARVMVCIMALAVERVTCLGLGCGPMVWVMAHVKAWAVTHVMYFGSGCSAIEGLWHLSWHGHTSRVLVRVVAPW